MEMKRILLVVLWSLLAFALAGTPALAQGEEAGEEGTGVSLWDLIKASMPIGAFILLCSIAAMALIIEHYISIRRDKLCPPEIVGELEALLEEEQYEEAMALCDSERTFLTNMVGAAVAKVGAGYEEMVRAMEDITEEETFKLNVKIGWLSLIGNVSPMLGLLGTVTGMIAAFAEIAAKTSPSPADLASGVYQALVTTCMGLIVAIPVLSFFFVFRNRVTKLSIEIGLIAQELMERFRG